MDHVTETQSDFRPVEPIAFAEQLLGHGEEDTKHRAEVEKGVRRRASVAQGLLKELSPEQLAETVALHEELSGVVSAHVHTTWALSWLAMHASDSGNVGFRDETYREAVEVVLAAITRETATARAIYERQIFARYQAAKAPRP